MIRNGLSHRRGWRESAGIDVLVLLIFIVATAIFTYPKILCLPSCVRNSGDPLLNAWILAWDVHKLTTNLKGFFNANIFYPHLNTLAYSETQLANALLAMPILLIFHNPVLAHNWVQLFSFAASGFGMYLLVQHLTSSRIAGIVSGVVFAFCPYKMAHSQLQMLATQWMPLALLYLDKSLREQKWQNFLFLTLFFNLQALSSYYYALFFTLTVGVLSLLYLLVERGKLWSKRLVPRLACCALLTLSIQLSLASPYFRLAHMGFVRTEETTRLFQATWADYLTATPENWLYGSLTAPLRGPYWSEHTASPGVLAAILAILWVVNGLSTLASPSTASSDNKPSQARVALMYAFLLVFSVVMAMGTSWEPPGTDVQIHLPFGWLFNHMPGFRGVRVPSRFNVITMLALAVLSGYGMARVENSLRKGMPPLKAAVGVILPVLVAFEYLAVPVPYAAVVPSEIPEVYKWLATLEEDAVVLELPFPSTTDAHPNWAVFPFVEGWRVYFSAFHWKRMVNGYSGFLPPGYSSFVEDMLGFPDESSISRLHEIGVTYVILHQDMLDPEQRNRVRDGLKKFSSDLLSVREFGEVRILKVEPQGGQAIRDLIKQTTFDGKMSLIGFGVDKQVLRPGESFTLSLLWRAVGSMNQDYTVFVHLVDEKGHLLGQHDSQPQEGKVPTSTWRLGEVVRDQHHLVVSPDASPGVAYLIIGVYRLSTMERLPLIDEDGQVLDDKVTLMSLEVNED